ncbi:hypothetical protein AMECASPLE_001382 [Ameca splendens]|uniref:Uncharacterized protein n=1 Tax=Ameca splendens TaxID=208324 RepID=A0ABV0Z6V3_9TELE
MGVCVLQVNLLSTLPQLFGISVIRLTWVLCRFCVFKLFGFHCFLLVSCVPLTLGPCPGLLLLNQQVFLLLSFNPFCHHVPHRFLPEFWSHLRRSNINIHINILCSQSNAPVINKSSSNLSYFNMFFRKR